MHSRTGMIAAILMTCMASPGNADAAETFGIQGSADSALQAASFATFDGPGAMSFLPDGEMLVTTRPGKMIKVSRSGGD